MRDNKMDGINGFEREREKKKRNWRLEKSKNGWAARILPLSSMLALLLFADLNGRAKVIVKAAWKGML